VKDRETGEWRKNEELEKLLRKENILNVIRRFQWAMRSQNNLIRMIMDENSVGKRPLGRPQLRWEDVIIKDMETLKTIAMDRVGWRIGCVMVLMAGKPKKKNILKRLALRVCKSLWSEIYSD